MENLTRVVVPTQTAMQLGTVLLLPQDRCCNCGGREGLTLVPMPLPTADLTGEMAIPLSMPHCAMCLPTARRMPPRLGRTITFFPLSFFVCVGLAAAVMSALGRRPGGDNSTAMLLLISTVVALVLPFVLLRWRPPQHQGQTSRYQAVRITLHTTFLGKIDSITFAFTNASYAQQFKGIVEATSASAGAKA